MDRRRPRRHSSPVYGGGGFERSEKPEGDVRAPSVTLRVTALPRAGARAGEGAGGPYYFAMRSNPPMYGTSAFGTLMLPSAFW